MSEVIRIAKDPLITPNIHDAKITGLLNAGNNEFLLLLELADGSDLALSFLDTSYLRATDFREGNIALDMEVLTAEKSGIADIAPLYDADITETDELLLNLLDVVRENKSVVVKISASYGCTITCICGRVLGRKGVGVRTLTSLLNGQ